MTWRELATCPACGVDESAAEAARYREREQIYNALIDQVDAQAFRTIRREYLPEGGRELDRVLTAWTYESGQGLLLIGPTGSGKTRCAWQVVRREIVEHGRRVRVYGAIAFGHEATERAYDGTTRAWLDKLARVPLLMIDDIGKEKTTEAREEAMFHLIDRRAANMLPTIYTSNFDGDELVERIKGGRRDGGDSGYADPMVRRMRDTCIAVVFTEGSRGGEYRERAEQRTGPDTRVGGGEKYGG
jgi:DNA replication protein DnaC